jgi:hypothetical protein
VLACLLAKTIGRRYWQMLWTIILILLVLWLLGGFVLNLGGLIHLLLVIALIVLLVQLISGRRVAL